MNKKLNNRLIDTVLSNVPKNVKPVSLLSNLLDMSRESAYRRIRGDIPFTVEEIADLSLEMGFSIDGIVGLGDRERVFFDFSVKSDDSDITFISMLQRLERLYQSIGQANHCESILALNSLSPTFFLHFNHLFKFIYFKWLQQDSSISSDILFSEIKVPEEINNLRKKISNNMKVVSNRIIILDPNIFLNLIHDIVYFNQRKLINNEDMVSIKAEISELIDIFEKMAKSGIMYNTNVSLYISSLSINTSTVYVNINDSEMMTILLMLVANPIFINNLRVCEVHKKTLLSVKRQSTLITQSNEILQIEFFDRQREYLKNIFPNS
ncbi:MAG: hypothetical protein LBR13_05595 [Dysgonamonadaceae bacterium]|jgi:hypothetical protein|nr:hypothetical protein [Dysgonamonadaceae bacterium]